MHDVAIASGFGCVRRFNAAILKTYNRTPTQIRRLARQKEVLPKNQYLFQLRFRPPYQWEQMLAFLAARAIPGVEAVDSGVYRRTISLQGSRGYFEVSKHSESDALAVRVQIADSQSLYTIVERIRSLFDLNADWSAIAQVLSNDPELRERIRAQPGVRVPGCWNGFELAARAILGQQISVKGASTLAGRMANAFGEPFAGHAELRYIFPTPEVLADADLGKIGLTRKRAETIRALARAVCDGRIRFDGIYDSDAFLAGLVEIPGIGPWTAQYVAMRAMGEPDAFPTGDLGLLRALGLRSAREMDRRAEAWRPWRSYASMYLWSVAKCPA